MKRERERVRVKRETEKLQRNVLNRSQLFQSELIVVFCNQQLLRISTIILIIDRPICPGFLLSARHH